jgi:hypothetical protein
VRNEIETKRNETKPNETKRNQTKRNETDRNETKRNQTKRNETTLHFVSFRFVSISFRTLQLPYFISYKHNFIEQKRKYVIFLDIGGILEKGVHESSVCDTGVYRFPNFYILKQFPFQIPYNLDHFFQFSVTFNNSFSPFQFPYPSIFATCYPFPEIFTSFPFPPNRANSPFYPSVRSSSPTYFTSTFISNSAEDLVSGEVLCDTLRLVWRVCVRPSLYPPQWFPDITWERISNLYCYLVP